MTAACRPCAGGTYHGFLRGKILSFNLISGRAAGRRPTQTSARSPLSVTASAMPLFIHFAEWQRTGSGSESDPASDGLARLKLRAFLFAALAGFLSS